MSAIFRATLLMLCVSIYAGAQNKSLALYVSEPEGLELSAVQSAQKELQRLLAPTQIDLVWKDLGTRKSGEQFDQVVVVSFDGSCSKTGLVATLPPHSQISLADSSVSDGAVLPFFRVDCGLLVQMLGPSLRTMLSQERAAAMGRALGRVMAHEIYHIVAETTEHQQTGVAKASFSLQDLIGDTFEFDARGVAQMRPLLPLLARSPTTPATPAAESEELLER